MTRRTKDERRRDYLDIGTELVAEASTSSRCAPGLALAHVRISEVARRAGVTKGALYHLWDSQEAYWQDLLRYLLAERRLAGPADLAGLTRQLTEVEDARPSVPRWANLVFDHFKDEPGYFARVGVISYLYDDELRAGLDDELRAGLVGLEELIDGSVRAAGRRLRPGVELRDVAVAVSALLQGLCLEHRVEPGRTPDLDVDGARVSLFAAGVEGLLDAFSEPVRPAGPGAGEAIR